MYVIANPAMKNKREKNKILQCRFQGKILMNDSLSGNHTERSGNINIYNIVISRTVPKKYY